MEPRVGWKGSILHARGEIERLLGDSPSLRPAVGAMIAREIPQARGRAVAALALHGEQQRLDLSAVDYIESQVLGDWFSE